MNTKNHFFKPDFFLRVFFLNLDFILEALSGINYNFAEIKDTKLIDTCVGSINIWKILVIIRKNYIYNPGTKVILLLNVFNRIFLNSFMRWYYKKNKVKLNYILFSFKNLTKTINRMDNH